VTSEGFSPGLNIDFIWGAVMIGFGLICLWIGRRESRKRGRRSSND